MEETRRTIECQLGSANETLRNTGTYLAGSDTRLHIFDRLVGEIGRLSKAIVFDFSLFSQIAWLGLVKATFFDCNCHDTDCIDDS